MPVSYSTVKSVSGTKEMAELLTERVIGPVLPSIQVRKVRTKQGRRFEPPRVMWNVYEAELEMPGGIEARPLFWTKTFFSDADCEQYHARVAGLLANHDGNPLDRHGFGKFFPDLNMFMFFFPLDPIFPRLGKVFDTDTAMPFIAEHFKRLRPDREVRSVTSVRVKYLPEISCIIRYEADIGEEKPLSIYGKVQPTRRGSLTFQVMRTLWDLPARAAGELVVAEPLGYHQSHNLLLQSELPGDEIPSGRSDDVFLAQCEAAGRTIGYIHSSGLTAGNAHTIAVEIDRLQGRLDEFKLTAPRVYFMLRDLLKQISAKAERVPAEAVVPSHGDYKYNQFLYDGEHFGLIDVEYFAQAEPSFDLGKYAGHLPPAAPTDWSDTAAAEHARRVFLDAYMAVRPQYQGRRFAIYEALSLATRALVVTWAQSRNFEYMAETLIALAYEKLKTPWGS